MRNLIDQLRVFLEGFLKVIDRVRRFNLYQPSNKLFVLVLELFQFLSIWDRFLLLFGLLDKVSQGGIWLKIS